MAKRPRLEPIKIHSAEAMRGTVAEYCRLLAERTERKALLDQEVIGVQARHAEDLNRLDMAIARHEQAVAVFCEIHRDEIFPEKRKSLDLPSAVVGFRINPPKVEKGRGMGKVPEKDLAVRLASVEIREGGREDGALLFRGEDYVRFGDPGIDKAKLIADRDIIPAEAFSAAGISVVQEEEFFISPKAEAARE
ncbi:MAG TPA: host-nuclease inhibitor Gam family protein [Verrucomicrobiae bacterium]|mgnify:CR=1 FL=1|nr:host-nuclease inhibitor Gam family protein [Verrucomicrobiae bacterium]